MRRALNNRLNEGTQRKKRSNRSKSRTNSVQAHQQPKNHVRKSPSTARLLSLDSSFEHFDILRHEREVKSYKSGNVTDFKGIVSGTYSNDRDKPKLSSVQVLKSGKMSLSTATVMTSKSVASTATSPFELVSDLDEVEVDVDANCDLDTDPESALLIPFSSRAPNPGLLENDTEIPNIPNGESEALSESGEPDLDPDPHSDPVTSTPEGQVEVTDVDSEVGPGTSIALILEAMPYSFNDVDEWESAFTKTYKAKHKLIENSTELSQRQKLEQVNRLYQDWIEDLYQQLDRFYYTFYSFQQAAIEDGKEFLEEVTDLEDKLQTAQRSISHEQGKVESLEKENFRKGQIIEACSNNLQKMISTLKIEKFRNVSNNMERDLEGNMEIKQEQEQLLKTLEKLNGKIFCKEKRLQKLNIEEQDKRRMLQHLNIEEQAFKLRIRAAASEEALRVGQLGQYQGQPGQYQGHPFQTERTPGNMRPSSRKGRRDSGDEGMELNSTWRHASASEGDLCAGQLGQNQGHPCQIEGTPGNMRQSPRRPDTGDENSDLENLWRQISSGAHD